MRSNTIPNITPSQTLRTVASIHNHSSMTRLRYLFHCFIIAILYFSCKEKSKEIAIEPLSPYVYVTSPDDYSWTGDSSKIKVKYFLVSGHSSDTSKLKAAIIKVADTAKGIDFASFDRIQLEFYKSSGKLNQNFIDSDNNPLGDYYESNFIAEATWVRGEFWRIAFYDKGNIINNGKDVELKRIN